MAFLASLLYWIFKVAFLAWTFSTIGLRHVLSKLIFSTRNAFIIFFAYAFFTAKMAFLANGGL